jgi:hypothetical protein
LTEVHFQQLLVIENFIAALAVRMLFEIVVYEPARLSTASKVLVARLTISMTRALTPMLLE